MPSTRDVDRFLAGYPEPVRETAAAARHFLAGMLPRAEESLDKAAKLISYRYGHGYKGMVCTLILSQTGVKLGIVRGAELSDPMHLLTGGGRLHRHVQLRAATDLRRPGLARLVEDALAAWRNRNAVDD